MKTKAGMLAALGVVLVLVAAPASAHSDPCHSRHSCPSDHHTYVWVDPSTGSVWDCARPGADEYDPARDTTTITWLGLPYHCRPGRHAGDAEAAAAGTEPRSAAREHHARRAERFRSSAHDSSDDLQGRLDGNDPPVLHVHVRAQAQADAPLR